jgi:thiopeptide-type bacteriocin biosynthesis protein
MDGLLQDGLVRRYTIATYEREIERYGGPAALDLCERLFTVSSRWSIARIARRESKEARITGSVSDALALARASMTSRQLAELLAILQASVPRQKASQADRTFLREAQAALESGASQHSDPEIAAIASEFRGLSDLELTKSLPQVFPSLHHMHCNRLGLSKDEETRSSVLFAKALFSICRTGGALVPGMTVS